MRRLVEPAPTGHCDRCGGELRFKLVASDSHGFDIEAQIYACANCGAEYAHRVTHDRYAGLVGGNKRLQTPR